MCLSIFGLHVTDKLSRYEQAKKKVRSQKAVYKGGLAGKPYGGEQSGITKVVKSVKLV